ncbi:MAG: tRNA (adenosine(37)-N6)-threonylcarbamoyltransferase complex dimerization subunit type 1 TsaB [Vigna little leaf phytoplasma]|nr:tRNA (adenosine(37)-N6)-threonylcarbamoyltransferase complex dimerization subunit type 1 TsaB [Vigna little leaf phytoplasma]
MLDVAANVQCVWLITQNNIINQKKYIHRTNFIENMIPLLHQALEEKKISLKEIDGIIVGIGPGSYMGTRLSVVTAKILSLELKIPLFSLSSLLLLSSGYNNKKLTPKIYARQNLFYSLSYEQNKIILPENIYEQSFLDKFSNNLILNEHHLKINPQKIFKKMQKVINPQFLIPSYY